VGLSIAHVDAFTDTPFAGNPAAVCILSHGRAADWMQSVARELNLSETAFLEPRDDGFALRWFTPAVEVDLCGHATLASAHILWEDSRLARAQEARFHTRSGLLAARRAGEWIELDMPAHPPAPAAPPPGLFDALGVSARPVLRSRFDYLLELESEEGVRALTPDYVALSRVDARGVIVTSRAAATPFDFVSRFFAPRVGVNEDPVTGSAHCTLAPFWTERLGRADLIAYQASPRGGVVRTHVRGDGVTLGGQAVTVLRCELL